MIIKAGTYRWNDTPTAYDVTIGSGTGMGIPFLLPEFSFVVQEQTVTLQFRGTDIVLTKDASSKFYLVYDGSFVDEDSGAISDGDFVAYTGTEGWNAFEILNDSVSNFDIIKTYLPDDYAKTFTIPVDTEVDDDKGTWFNSNTTMLIKAGTYRWNDYIQAPTQEPINAHLPYSFTVNPQGIILDGEKLAIGVDMPLSHIGYFNNCIAYMAEDDGRFWFTSNGISTVHSIVFAPYYLGVWSPHFSMNDVDILSLNTIFEINLDGFGQIITITEDTYVPTNFGLWATSNWKKQGEEEETYTIGSGIYKFHDTVERPSTDFSQEMSFAVVGSEQINEGARYRLMETGRDMYLDFISVDSDAGIAFYAFEETSDGNIGFLWDTQTIQVLEPIKASAVFNDWFGASTEKIVNPDTIKAKVQSLIAKANSTTGKSDTDLTSGVNSLIEGYGQGDSCSGNHIIEVDELPTENIDENALYKVGDSYYRCAKELKDIFYVDSGIANSIVAMLVPQGATVELYYVDTKPTENIKALDEENMILPAYYVADENDVFFYAEGEWMSASTVMGGTNGGVITNASQATTEGSYYALIGGGWKVYNNGSLVIKVDKLPTEHIDENAIYCVKTTECVDAMIPLGSLGYLQWKAYCVNYGLSHNIFNVDALPTENMGETIDEVSSYLYYVASENKLYVYQGGVWVADYATPVMGTTESYYTYGSNGFGLLSSSATKDAEVNAQIKRECSWGNGSRHFTYTLSDDGTYYELDVGPKSTLKNWAVASEINGIPVTKIGGCDGYGIPDNPFYLTTLVIPDTITRIERNAFYTVHSVDVLVIGKGVTYIGENFLKVDYPVKLVVYAGSEEEWAAVTKPAGVPFYKAIVYGS